MSEQKPYSPETLAEREEKYHRRWRARRRKGEWFTIGDCITNEIERLTCAVENI